MSFQNIISLIFMGTGFFFMTLAAIGVIKFPDFFTRLHASGVGETLGALMIILGIIIYTESIQLSIKVFIIFFILLLTNPIGTNLIMLAAVRSKNYQDYNHKRIKEPEIDEVENVTEKRHVECEKL